MRISIEFVDWANLIEENVFPLL